MLENFFYFAWYFLIFGFLGWIVDTLGHLVMTHRLVKKGMLFGPITPIYSFGGLFIYAVGENFAYNPALLFIVVTIACTALEYVVGRLLYTLFHRRWWSYKNLPLNIDGYIALLPSLLWGVLGLLQIYVLMDLINNFIASLNTNFGWILLIILVVIFCTDLILTAISILHLRSRWRAIVRLGKIDLYEQRLNLRNKLNQLQKLSFNQRRLMRAFPQLWRSFQQSVEKVLPGNKTTS